MKPVQKINSEKLMADGLNAVELKRLLIDVDNMLEDVSCLSFDTVNKKLRNIGWDEETLSYYFFILITALLERRESVDSN